MKKITLGGTVDLNGSPLLLVIVNKPLLLTVAPCQPPLSDAMWIHLSYENQVIYFSHNNMTHVQRHAKCLDSFHFVSFNSTKPAHSLKILRPKLGNISIISSSVCSSIPGKIIQQISISCHPTSSLALPAHTPLGLT